MNIVQRVIYGIFLFSALALCAYIGPSRAGAINLTAGDCSHNCYIK